jgi:hypothetical protein
VDHRGNDGRDEDQGDQVAAESMHQRGCNAPPAEVITGLLASTDGAVRQEATASTLFAQ